MNESHVASRRTMPAVAGAVVAVLLVAALALWLSNRDDDVAPAASTDDAGQTPTEPAPEEPTATDEAPVVPDVDAVDPTAAADRASAAGVPALVPDVLADQFGVVSAASYDDDSALWRLDVTTGTGTVVVRQSTGQAADLVADHAPSAVQGDDVDLARWGLGAWATWTTDDGALISRDLPGGGAIVSGPDLDTVTQVAKTLLTHEENRGGEQD